MIILIKTLLVNITILFSFTFNANIFFPFQPLQQLQLKQKISYGFIGSLGALFCMFYPIETLGATHFDLRMIAIMITTIYGGLLSGSMVLVVVCFTRYLIGGPFVVIGLAVSIIAFIVALAFQKMLLRSQHKLLVSALILSVYSALYIIIIHFTITMLELPFYIIYFSTFYFTFLSLVMIIERLIKTNAQIEEMVYLDKLNMVGQMAASIAHEIRNPLSTVRGFIQHLSEDTKDEQFKRFSPLILDELDRTNKIITDYLNITKPEKFHLSAINLTRIIQTSVDLLRPFAAYSNTSILFEMEKEYFILGDEHHLKQAIMNVIKNGIESTENERGTVTIDIRSGMTSDTIEILISDDGIGMTQEELSKIGLPFYTTKSKGTGLGSMVTNKIIREMHGRIEYESQLAKGTTVRISLPLHEDGEKANSE
ncbi:two-component sensor histidine kinase [Rossellomorea vietnamensis]|uniref:histidine kinase n=1 Tax=Rossellomorea vietnamensis TaxID=218284 RepID=A0A5D4MED9_9BACI|nr:ATP-binding protein [Rossellomorea vietnamensis]TYR99848.1 two-component sensor histidine kinase [Rossellomorea vietnamensis]